jgi:hypothetical protein
VRAASAARIGSTRPSRSSALLRGDGGVTIYSLLEIVALIGLAVATWRHHLWATYALVGMGLLTLAAQVVTTGTTGWPLPLAFYLVGAFVLARSAHVIPASIDWKRILRFALLYMIGVVSIGFVSGFLFTFRYGIQRTISVAYLVDRPRPSRCR